MVTMSHTTKQKKNNENQKRMYYNLHKMEYDDMRIREKKGTNKY